MGKTELCLGWQHATTAQKTEKSNTYHAYRHTSWLSPTENLMSMQVSQWVVLQTKGRESGIDMFSDALF